MKRLASLVVPMLLCPVLAACGNAPSREQAPATPRAGSGTASPAVVAVPKGARELQVPGTESQVFVTRETHPRGGFQMHVFVGMRGNAVELTAAEVPIVPFVATDVSGPGASADCGEGAIVVRAATPAANGRLKVTERTFAIVDGAAVQRQTRVLATSLDETEVAARFPDVARRTMFAHC